MTKPFTIQKRTVYKDTFEYVTVTKCTTLKGARRTVDRLDNEHGGCAHHIIDTTTGRRIY